MLFNLFLLKICHEKKRGLKKSFQFKVFLFLCSNGVCKWILWLLHGHLDSDQIRTNGFLLWLKSTIGSWNVNSCPLWMIPIYYCSSLPLYYPLIWLRDIVWCRMDMSMKYFFADLEIVGLTNVGLCFCNDSTMIQSKTSKSYNVMFLTDWLAMATQLFRGAKNIHLSKNNCIFLFAL